MTLQEAFSFLIKIPVWYKDSGVLKQIAYRDKRRFLSNELPEERMRFYLVAAGWRREQEESWIKADKNGKESK